jgi:hypothetical protein
LGKAHRQTNSQPGSTEPMTYGARIEKKYLSTSHRSIDFYIFLIVGTEIGIFFV